MHIMDIPITNYNDTVTMETEICRLLRCSNSKCAAIHTEAFMHFRANLLNIDINPLPVVGGTVYMPEGLVLKIIFQEGCSYVQLSWRYADTTQVLL
jgi:hypothetical protein